MAPLQTDILLDMNPTELLFHYDRMLRLFKSMEDGTLKSRVSDKKWSNLGFRGELVNEIINIADSHGFMLFDSYSHWVDTPLQCVLIGEKHGLHQKEIAGILTDCIQARLLTSSDLFVKEGMPDGISGGYACLDSIEHDLKEVRLSMHHSGKPIYFSQSHALYSIIPLLQAHAIPLYFADDHNGHHTMNLADYDLCDFLEQRGVSWKDPSIREQVIQLITPYLCAWFKRLDQYAHVLTSKDYQLKFMVAGALDFTVANYLTDKLKKAEMGYIILFPKRFPETPSWYETFERINRKHRIRR